MATRSLNKVMLIGNLTRDPELRYTPQGTAVCTFGLATNRSWTDANGQQQEEAEFHRIVAWRKLAELCAQLLFKGRRAYVEGRIQTRNWTDSSGQERVTTEVIIFDMLVLDTKHKEGGMPAREGIGAQVPKSENTIAAPPTTKSPTTAKVSEKKEEVKEDVNADEIPF